MADSESQSTASRIDRRRLRDTAVSSAFFAALLWMMSQSVFAQTQTYDYSYQGNTFTSFQCDSGGSPDCPPPAPGQTYPGNPYSGSDYIYGRVTTSSPLGANYGPQDVDTDPNHPPTDVALSDQHRSIHWDGNYANGRACIKTDGNGKVSAWYLDTGDIDGNGDLDIYSFYDPTGVFANVPRCQHPAVANGIYGQDFATTYDPNANVQRYAYTNSSSATVPQGSWTSPAGNGSGAHQVGGTLSGLPASGTVVLQDNGGDNLTLSSNGTFSFATPVPDGNPYVVTVRSEPAGYRCGVTNGYGTVNGADVTNIQVNCGPSKTYSYSGKGFKLFECATSPDTDCSTPGPGNPYRASNSITGALTLIGALPNNLGPTNLYTRPDLKLTLNDGQRTLINRTDGCSSCVGAWVTTDATGALSAWFLMLNDGDSGHLLFTVYDPGGVIAAACNNCYSVYTNSTAEDRGQSIGNPVVYGYNRLSPGPMPQPYPGGSTTAGNCISSGSLPCSLVPGNSFAIRGPNVGAIPPGAIITQQECVVPADPRGPNCGASNGNKPRTLKVSDLPQCKGFGNELIPDNLCGASGASGTGFALILGNAEQADSFNGIYGDSELDVEKIPDLAGGASNPACPKSLPGTLPSRPSAPAIVATRSGSLVEEQTPEKTPDGRPIFVEMTSSCDPPKSNHGPGLTLEGVGFKLLADDPAVIGGQTRDQRLLNFANNKFVNLKVVLLYTKFRPTSTRQNLQSCLNKSQNLLNAGPTHYFCAAEQIYRCERMVEATDFHKFGPSHGPLLRLPDPYGDAVRRLGNLFYTINTRINHQQPNADWPLPVSPGHPAGDPYPNLGCP